MLDLGGCSVLQVYHGAATQRTQQRNSARQAEKLAWARKRAR